jgi:fructose-bisphosphate aldolase class 1
VQEAIWAETFKYMADNKVMLEGILLKPAMVTPGKIRSLDVWDSWTAQYS